METVLGVKIEPREAERGAAVVKKAIDDIRGSARGLNTDFLETFSGRAILAGGIVGGLGVVSKALLDTANYAAKYVGEIKDLSQHSSLATREASAFGYAARLNGTSVQDLSIGLSHLNANMIEAISGTGDGARLFKALGVSVTDTSGQLRGTSDVFLDVVDHLKMFNDDGAKSTVISKLLGNQMQDMARTGKDAMVSQTQEAERLGRTLDEKVVAQTDAWNKSTVRLKETLSGLTTDIGTALIPKLTSMSDIIQHTLEILIADGRALGNLMMPNKLESPEIGVIRREGESRNLRILPPPPGIDKAVVDKNPFFNSSLAEGLAPDLRGKQLDAELARRTKAMQGDLDRTRTALIASGQLFGLDAQRQMVTAEDVTNFKGTLQLRELAKEGETLSRQKQMEDQFYAERVKIGFKSTEERISEEEKYKGKAFDLNQAILTNTQAFGIASEKNIEEQAVARGIAEKDLGERTVAYLKSTYDISETIRQRDFEAIGIYYQGEFDMANARFASDEEIAGKERELLREQLAYKLKLTQEEVRTMLFLRNANDFEGVRQIAGRADPTLSPRAVEGMVESAAAKDRLAAERANGNFFAGWSRGLQKYSRDRDTAFGMSTDMARRTAQAMEQGFQTFFFDVFDRKIKTFKDVMVSVLDFTKQIIAQMTAQMVTAGIIRGISAFTGGGGGGLDISTTPRGPAPEMQLFPQRFGGLMPLERYASGGITSRPQMAIFGEGAQSEAFVPLPDGRTIPVTMRFAGAMPTGPVAGGGPTTNTINIAIEVHPTGANERQQSGTNAPPNYAQLARDLSKLVEAKLIEEQRPGGLLAGGRA